MFGSKSVSGIVNYKYFGGNFIGGDFEWSNTDETLTLVTGSGTTVYVIEEYSETKFVFSLTDENGNDKFVERWYLSK